MKILLLLLSFLFANKVLSQDRSPVEDNFRYKATYELTYQPDSTDEGSVTSETMWLYVGEKVSRFSSKGKALKDSLETNISIAKAGSGSIQARAGATKTDFDYSLYKGFPEGKLSYTLKILRDRLRYEEDMDLFEWEILSETRSINGYQSQKARTSFGGRDYIAWFTSEIPVSEGPYKFNGLPGLYR